MGDVKYHILSLFKTKDYSKPEPIKTVCGGGKKQSEENTWPAKWISKWRGHGTLKRNVGQKEKFLNSRRSNC